MSELYIDSETDTYKNILLNKLTDYTEVLQDNRILYGELMKRIQSMYLTDKDTIWNLSTRIEDIQEEIVSTNYLIRNLLVHLDHYTNGETSSIPISGREPRVPLSPTDIKRNTLQLLALYMNELTIDTTKQN